MTTTLVIPGPIADEIAAATQNPLESAGVLLARRVETGKDVRLLRWCRFSGQGVKLFPT